MKRFSFAWRLLRRDLASGELLVLVAALVLAVAAVAGVGFVTDRTSRALAREANQLLGADAVLRADEPIADVRREDAQRRSLTLAETSTFRSMVRAGETFQLVEVKAVSAAYPLRGALEEGDAVKLPQTAPPRGTIWATERLAQLMGLRRGSEVALGTSTFSIDRIVTREPDAALDYLDLAPRLYLNLEDLAGTGLVQEGSRIGYRLMVAGSPEAVSGWVAATRDALARGQRIETVQDARPELRMALERADRFLALAALSAAILAGIAIAMAARRHAARHLDAAAVLRCLGATSRDLVAASLVELLLLGLAAGAIGVLLALAVQAGLGAWLAGFLDTELPAPGFLPALEGLAVALVLLVGFALAPILRIHRTPTLRVLRRELEPTEPRAFVTLLLALLAVGALFAWKAKDATLAAAVLGGLVATAAVLALLAAIVLSALSKLRKVATATRDAPAGRAAEAARHADFTRSNAGAGWRGGVRLGLAAAARRRGASVAQTVALGLGLMAIVLLTLVRTDLLARWSLEAGRDAPDQFLINVQPEQVRPVRDLLRGIGGGEATLYPMVRGRLVAVNGKAITGDNFEEGRARRLAEREFNLSWADELPAANEVVAGKFHARPASDGAAGSREPAGAAGEWSVEAEIAASLGWQLGDVLAFDIAGRRVEAKITSLRRVEWESFRPNFFVLASPGVLDAMPASYITSFRAPKEGAAKLAPLVAQFPNVTLIDVGRILGQIARTAQQVSRAVEYVFLFTLAAGLLVLLATVVSSQDERLREGAVLRALGARRSQLVLAQLAEFGALGLAAGLVGSIAAGAIAAVLSEQVFDLPGQWNVPLLAGATLAGTAIVIVFGLAATRRVVKAPPAESLRRLAA